MAYHGMSWRQFDPTAVTIKVLVWLKLAKNVKLPRPELVSRRKAAPEPKGASSVAAD
jgi:fatty-acid desaturase